MRIARPWAIEIDYVRDMMAWLLFLAPPPRILQLGLGAAALTKYCWRRYPESRVTAVERSGAVIASARRDFALPPDDERLRVVRADAGEFVARRSEQHRYGVIQVDLYDRQARGPVIDSLAFYRRCRRALAPSGILVVNLFGEHDSYLRSTGRVGEAFDGRLLTLPPLPAGNVVLLAFEGPPLRIALTGAASPRARTRPCRPAGERLAGGAARSTGALRRVCDLAVRFDRSSVAAGRARGPLLACLHERAYR